MENASQSDDWVRGLKAGGNEAIYHLTGGIFTGRTRHADGSKVIAGDLVLLQLLQLTGWTNKAILLIEGLY